MTKKILLNIKNNSPLYVFAVLGLMAFLSQRSQGTSTEISVPQALSPNPSSVDTFIPKGFVLVPLELANAESLASLVGELGGVVDLYQTSVEGGSRGTRVGQRLKILRAPLNPQQYAVLVKDDESSRILSYPGPFMAVVQNPEARGSEITATSKSRLNIQYQN